MTQEEEFALMLREALTEYDFSEIDFSDEKAVVRLRREIFALDGKKDVIDYAFSDPKLVSVLKSLRDYFPSV